MGTQRGKQKARPNMSNPSLRDRDVRAWEPRWGQREGRDKCALSASPGEEALPQGPRTSCVPSGAEPHFTWPRWEEFPERLLQRNGAKEGREGPWRSP